MSHHSSNLFTSKAFLPCRDEVSEELGTKTTAKLSCAISLIFNITSLEAMSYKRFDNYIDCRGVTLSCRLRQNILDKIFLDSCSRIWNIEENWM